MKKYLFFVIGLVVSALMLRKQQVEPQRLRRLDYSGSAQRLGIRFTESLRDRWRRRWLKIHP
jgi:hypothetical protein